jgi:hypothetical protein
VLALHISSGVATGIACIEQNAQNQSRPCGLQFTRSFVFSEEDTPNQIHNVKEWQMAYKRSIGQPSENEPQAVIHAARHDKGEERALSEIASDKRPLGRLPRRGASWHEKAANKAPEGTKAAKSAQLTITYRPLRELVPYARNARTHSAKQIDKIRASLAKFGWANPMLTAGETLIAGHARLAAALLMAEAGEVIARNADPWTAPTVDLSHLSAVERRAYIIADNKIALDGGWDHDLLQLEMTDLKVEGFDLSVIGFSGANLSSLFGTRDEGDHTGNLGGMVYQVVVECSDETQQGELLGELQQRGLKCKPLIL